MSGAPDGAPVSLEFLFSILIETVFAHIFPVSNENKKERRILHTIIPKKKKLEKDHRTLMWYRPVVQK
jgi:hypothetical protein